MSRSSVRARAERSGSPGRWLSYVAALLLAAGLALAGCSSSESLTAGGSASDDRQERSAKAEASESGVAGESAAPESGAAADSSDGESADADADASGDGSDATLGRAQLTDRAVVRTGRLTIEVPDVRRATAKAAQLVGGTNGYVETEESRADDDGELTTAQVVIRVEVDDYDRAADELRDLGDVVVDESETTDVTDEMVDVQSRIESQEESLARVRSLLAEAESVGEVIDIESELTSRQAELESLQARHATLTEQSALSTLTVDFETPDDDPPSEQEEDEKRGFVWGIGQGWSALTTMGTEALTVAGALLPFVLLASPLGVTLWFVLRHYGRRRHQAAVSAAASRHP